MKKLYSIIALFFSLTIFSQPAGWKYSMPITVKENSGSLVLNYQLKVIFNSQALITALKMNTNCSDIRFWKNCSGSSSYNYWIEGGVGTTTTTVWVKIDSLPANATKTIFMFYGNAGAIPTSTVPGTFIGPFSSTDSVASGGNGGVGNSQRGFKFQPNEDILVTDFGKREPTGTTRYVTLFDDATTNIISQTQVSGPALTYSYAPISNPVWLMQSAFYILQLYQGTSDGYTFGSSSQINSHLTYVDMRYCNSCTQNTFPTNTLSNYHYGYPDLWFYTKNKITPAPTYTVNSEVAVTAVANPTVICSGVQSSTLMASGVSTYSWNTGATTSVTVVSPVSTANYTVYGVDMNGCKATNTVQVVSLLCSNVQNLANGTSVMQVFPNPNNGEFNVSLPSYSENMQIEIYNSLGQIVLKEKVKDLNTVINLKNKANGIYILKVTENGKTIDKTNIVKQ